VSASTTALEGDVFCAMVLAAADALDANAAALSKLDALSGDGDHGANVQRAMRRARELIGALDAKSPAALFGAVASACGEEMAGAGGAVFAAFFGGAAHALTDELTVDSRTLAAALGAGLARVQRVGGAEAGDKTIVDALAPAVAAAREAADQGAQPLVVVRAAARAARAGAESTTALAAKVGRARYSASGGRGAADAGATTMALTFEAWAGALATPATSPDLDPGISNDPSAASPEPTDHPFAGRQ
jgi:dihydroxyacetone kinase-like protein